MTWLLLARFLVLALLLGLVAMFAWLQLSHERER
jgi:hypothetical protein